MAVNPFGIRAGLDILELGEEQRRARDLELARVRSEAINRERERQVSGVNLEPDAFRNIGRTDVTVPDLSLPPVGAETLTSEQQTELLRRQSLATPTPDPGAFADTGLRDGVSPTGLEQPVDAAPQVQPVGQQTQQVPAGFEGVTSIGLSGGAVSVDDQLGITLPAQAIVSDSIARGQMTPSEALAQAQRIGASFRGTSGTGQDTSLITNEEAQRRADIENERRQERGVSGVVTAEDMKSQYQRSLEAAKERLESSADRANAARIRMLDTARRMTESATGKTAVSRGLSGDTAFQIGSRRAGPQGKRDRSISALLRNRERGREAGDAFLRSRNAIRGGGVVDPADIDRLRAVRGVEEALDPVRQVDDFVSSIRSTLDEVTIDMPEADREAIKEQLKKENPVFAAVIEQQMQDENLFSSGELGVLRKRTERRIDRQEAIEFRRQERDLLDEEKTISEGESAYGLFSALNEQDPLADAKPAERREVLLAFGKSLADIKTLQSDKQQAAFDGLTAKIQAKLDSIRSGQPVDDIDGLFSFEEEAFGSEEDGGI